MRRFDPLNDAPPPDVQVALDSDSRIWLSAQRAAVEAYLNGGRWQLVEEHGVNRPDPVAPSDGSGFVSI